MNEDQLTLPIHGNPTICDIIAVFSLAEYADYQSCTYIAVFPQDGNDEILLFRWKATADDNIEIFSINGDEYEKALMKFDIIMQSSYNNCEHPV